jgi:2-polyprenyl-6-methoxyphenol hydroxylase-like FAD-dependent oxidoreductase
MASTNKNLGKRAFFGWIASPKGEINWFANVPSPLRADESHRQTEASVSRQEWKHRFLDLFTHDATPAADIIRSTAEHDGFTATLLNMLPHVPLWHRESMVLVGDAAHATSPTSGQGASLALEDSIMLAKSLRDISDVQQALTVYEVLRRRRVEKVAKLARRANQTKVAGPMLRGFQDLLLPIVFKYVVRPEAETWLYHYRIDWDEQVRKEVGAIS